MDRDDEILTLDEIAAYLKIGKRTVYRLAQKGGIPAFKLGGTWRFRLRAGLLGRRKHQQEEAGGRVSADQASRRITLGEEQGEESPLTTPQLEKPSWRKQQRDPEGKRSKLRRELFARQDEIEAQRNDLINQLEAQLQ